MINYNINSQVINYKYMVNFIINKKSLLEEQTGFKGNIKNLNI